MTDWFGPITIAPFTWTEAGTIAALLFMALLIIKEVIAWIVTAWK